MGASGRSKSMVMNDPAAVMRGIPQIDLLVERAAHADELAAVSRPLLVELVRELVDRYRSDLLGGKTGQPVDEFF